MVYSTVHILFILFGDKRVLREYTFQNPNWTPRRPNEPVYSANVVAKGDTELSYE